VSLRSRLRPEAALFDDSSLLATPLVDASLLDASSLEVPAVAATALCALSAASAKLQQPAVSTISVQVKSRILAVDFMGLTIHAQRGSGL
jgi:hypothetical protein